MLEGTCVLWEEKWSYYDLMKMWIDEGIASFNSEMMNEPIDPDSATFNEEWYDYYEEELVDFTDPDFVIVGSNDPSLGKNKKLRYICDHIFSGEPDKRLYVRCRSKC